VKFFQKDKDSCRTGLNKLMVDFPRGFYFNDAMSLLMVLDDSENADDVLYDYSNAMLFETMNNKDSAVYYLNKVADNSKAILIDLALIKLGRLERDRNDNDAALVYFNKIVNDYADSYHLPFALKNKAEILLTGSENIEAMEIYRKLLIEFPNYPFIEEIRKTLRNLEESDKSA